MLLENDQFQKKQEIADFSRFCEIVESIFHFEFHSLLEKLKDAYYPINPDLPEKNSITPEIIEAANMELIKTLRKILNDANYDVVSKAEITKAFNESAVMGFSVEIDLNEYEYIEIYGRGRTRGKFQIPRLFGLKKQEKSHDIFERVVLAARLKKEKTTIIKMFKNVPIEDLEILFPNSKITMSLRDKLIIFIPAVAGGIPLMATKVIPALTVLFLIISTYFGVKGKLEQDQLKQAVAVLSALGALGGFLFKQWSNYKNKKFHFQKELSDNLYFRNLVNNSGVFYSLIDSAEEEECKEAFLAYYFLYTASESQTQDSLDKEIENWFLKKHNCHLDFECADALAKLRRLQILEEDDKGILKVKPLEESLAALDRRWDNYFQYNMPEKKA